MFCVESSIVSRTFQGAHGAWHHFRPIETCRCAVCSVLTLPPHSLLTLLRKWNIPSPRYSVKENWFDTRKPVAWFHLCHYWAVSSMRQFPSFSALDMAMKYFSPWSKTGKSHLEEMQQKITEGCIVLWGIGWLAELYRASFSVCCPVTATSHVALGTSFLMMLSAAKWGRMIQLWARNSPPVNLAPTLLFFLQINLLPRVLYLVSIILCFTFIWNTKANEG